LFLPQALLARAELLQHARCVLDFRARNLTGLFGLAAAALNLVAPIVACAIRLFGERKLLCLMRDSRLRLRERLLRLRA
jgi:hypothetical protein